VLRRPVSGLLTDGRILSVAINDSGIGLIGGYSGGDPYAATIVDGVATTISGLSSSGIVSSVAINDSGVGLIGGWYNNDPNRPFAYIVVNNVAAEISNLPASGEILSVAINNAGEGVIGGYTLLTDSSQVAYAATVNIGTTTVTEYVPIESQYQINSVAINPVGVSLVGGLSTFSQNTPYAAFLSNGQVNEIIGLPEYGDILSVAFQTMSITGIRLKNDFGVVSEYFNALSWNNLWPSELASYRLLRNDILIATLNADATSYEDHNLLKSETDIYTINAYDESGILLDSASITIGR